MLERLWKPGLEKAGVRINGSSPWDPKIKAGHQTRLMLRVALLGSLGLGEAYMDGWWECDDLVGFFTRILSANMGANLWTLDVLWLRLKHRLFNLQIGTGAHTVGEKHYDLGNEVDDIYPIMLDSTLTYTCAFFQHGARTLEQAQAEKIRYSLEKLELSRGMRLLDIGCGWGHLAKVAAEGYGVRVTGITISDEQAAFAKKLCADLPVTIRKTSYETLQWGRPEYDRIISVGMFEQVGKKNADLFMQVVRSNLKPQGLALLHTITSPDEVADPWLHKYIFPNGMLLSESTILNAARGKLICEHMENFGLHYARTLFEWRKNYLAGRQRLNPKKYDERFHRMWLYYLSMCEAVFRAKNADLTQFVFSNGELDVPYIPPPRD